MIRESANHVKSMVNSALEDGVLTARRMAKRGRHAAVCPGDPRPVRRRRGRDSPGGDGRCADGEPAAGGLLPRRADPRRP